MSAVQLQRRHLSFELIARAAGRDAREQLIGRSGCERSVRKRVDRVCDVVHEDRYGVGVVDQIGDVPLSQVQVEQKLRRRSARSMRRGRDRRDEVEVASAGSRHDVERDRQCRGGDKVLSRRDCGVDLEDRADAELHPVERRDRKPDVQLAVGAEIERFRKGPERRHTRTGNDRASRHRGGQRRVWISRRQAVERVVEDLLTHGATPQVCLFVDTSFHAAPDVQRDAPGFVEARPVCDNDGHKARVLARVPAMHPDVEIVIDQ